MKKFKHKKTGEIASYEDGILKSSGFAVEIGVEPSKEFWEEIIEKEYEILSFKDKCSNRICTENDHVFNYYELKFSKWSKIVEFCLGQCKENWNIHSVKRLSDGEIFTIGDNTTKGIINNIFLQNINSIGQEYPVAVQFENNNLCALNFKYLSGKDKGKLMLQKIIKTPLFTTEDGVDIFEKDTKVYVNYYNFSKILEHFAYSIINSSINNTKVFSTKKAAEEYRLMNKPCLSINDVNVLKNIVFANWDKTLKDLVKSKL